MREIEYCRKKICPEAENNYEVVYYITVDDILGNNEAETESYGVGIRLENGDDDKIRGITFNAEKIEAIMKILSNGTVTPIGLRDVLDDMLGVII